MLPYRINGNFLVKKIFRTKTDTELRGSEKTHQMAAVSCRNVLKQFFREKNFRTIFQIGTFFLEP